MQLGRNRIEALTDGVFAVAMTLLVLDIKVPELQQPLARAELPLKLLSLWPKFLSYTISFVILGVYWVGHHVQLSFIRRADRPLLWINISFLLWVALVPFSTALLSEYATTRIAIAIYGANLIAIGLTLALHWWYATTENRHVDPDIDRGLVRGAMYRTLMGPLVYVIAIGPKSLPDLFAGRLQLIVYHFMWHWEKGQPLDNPCPGCAGWADQIASGHFNSLHSRNTTLVLVSRAPLAKILPFKKRMGWTISWYSSCGNSFNYDFHVTLDLWPNQFLISAFPFDLGLSRGAPWGAAIGSQSTLKTGWSTENRKRMALKGYSL